MSEQDQDFQNLLMQVSVLVARYEKIAEKTGENFNIFRILGLTANEVRTHSAFLAEMLNPNGTHGCKDAFLKLFIQEQRKKHKKLKPFNNIDTGNCTVSTEYNIGFINEDWTRGGRIDILIKDQTNKAIIIENKLYTGDRPKQLLRYKNAYEEAPIFYLTLEGSEPSDDSKGQLKREKDYACISYAKDIILWLDECRKEAVNHPLLRETITQYIFLLKYLTNQTLNDDMNKEIVKEITSNPNYFKAVFEISRSNLFSDVKEHLANLFLDQVDEIAQKQELKLTPTDEFIKGLESDCELRFKNPKSKYYIDFGFCYKNYDVLVYGIMSDERKYSGKDLDKINSILNNPGIVKPDYFNIWLWCDFFEPPFKSWDSIEPWLAIMNGSLIENFNKKITDLVQGIQEFTR
jgi:hypothetical protein